MASIVFAFLFLCAFHALHAEANVECNTIAGSEFGSNCETKHGHTDFNAQATVGLSDNVGLKLFEYTVEAGASRTLFEHTSESGNTHISGRHYYGVDLNGPVFSISGDSEHHQNIGSATVDIKAGRSFAASKEGIKINANGHVSITDKSRTGLNTIGAGRSFGTDGVSGSVEYGFNRDGFQTKTRMEAGITKEKGADVKRSYTKTTLFQTTSSERSDSLSFKGLQTKSTTTSEGLFTKTSTTKTRTNLFWKKEESNTEVTQTGAKAIGVAGAVVSQMGIVALQCKKGTDEECDKAKKEAFKSTAMSVAGTIPYLSQAMLLADIANRIAYSKGEGVDKIAMDGLKTGASALLGPFSAPVIEVAEALGSESDEQARTGLTRFGAGSVCAAAGLFTGPFAAVVAPVAYSACSGIMKVALE